MQHAIKIEDLDKPKKYWDDIAEVLQDFLKDGIGFMNEWIEELECRRRDGFIPFSHNKGGYRGYHYGNQMDYYICPTYNFDKFNKACEHSYNYHIESCLEYDKDIDMDKEAFNKALDNDENWALELRNQYEMEMLGDEYCSTFFECMMKIVDDNNIEVSFFLCASDAPYHRGYDDSIEFDIEFSSINELKNKLNKILDDNRVKEFINIIE